MTQSAKLSWFESQLRAFLCGVFLPCVCVGFSSSTPDSYNKKHHIRLIGYSKGMDGWIDWFIKMKAFSLHYFTEKTVMTVRRYSTNCSLAGVTMKDDGSDGTQQNNSGWGRLQEIQQKNRSFGNSSRGEEEKVTNRHSLQEYVHKNRYCIVKKATLWIALSPFIMNCSLVVI